MLHLVRRVPRNAALLVTLVMLIIIAPNVPIERSWWIVELLFDLTLLPGLRRGIEFAVGNDLGGNWTPERVRLRGPNPL